jgi:hypothetical protein
MTTMTRGQAITLTSEWFEYDGGPEQDLATLHITITSTDGGTVYLPSTAADIAHPALGNYAYTWAPDPPPPPGDLLVTWVGADSAGHPVQASEQITVVGTPTGEPTPTGYPPLLDDRIYISRYATQQVGFTAVVGGTPTDADGNTVNCVMLDANTGLTVLTRAADHFGTGIYGITLSGLDSQTMGVYDLHFTYAIGGVDDLNVVAIQIGPSYPAYDALDLTYRALVEHVWFRFADLFDSPLGGPFLQTMLQSHFTRNRLAQLMQVGVGRMNTIAQPHQTYTLDDADNPFPVAQWGALLEQMTYIEVVKHLIRSYVEQPQVNLSSAVSRLERRDYMQRWQDVLQFEMADLDRMIDTFKIANMGLGQSAVLISGGAYGNWGPTVAYGGAGMAAARGYFPARFYG